jgi:hypothetical protein
VQERLGQPVGGDHPAQRDVAGGQALGGGDDVGRVVVLQPTEVLAEAAEAADHVVRDHQDVVAVADLADPLEVSGRRREAAAGVLHRLEEDGGDGVRALELDRLGDPVGRPDAELLGAHRLVGAAVVVGVRHPERRRHERLEVLLQGRDAGDRQGAHRGAVVRDRPGQHLGLERLAGPLEERAGELPRRLDRLGAAGGEEDPVEVTGGQVGEPVGQLDGLGVRVRPDREVGELTGLLGGGLGELLPAVAGLHDEQRGQAVEVAPAVAVPHVAAVAAHDQRHLGLLVGRQAGEVQPEMVPGGAGELLEVG